MFTLSTWRVTLLLRCTYLSATGERMFTDFTAKLTKVCLLQCPFLYLDIADPVDKGKKVVCYLSAGSWEPWR
jgi:hypothetical protein